MTTWLDDILPDLEGVTPPPAPQVREPTRRTPKLVEGGGPNVGWLKEILGNPQDVVAVSTRISTSSLDFVSIGTFEINRRRYIPTPFFTFEAILEATPDMRAEIRLYDVGLAEVVEDTTLSTNELTATRVASPRLTVGEGVHLFEVQLRLVQDGMVVPTTADRATCKYAKVGVTYLE